MNYDNIEIQKGSQSSKIQMLIGICSSVEKDDLNGLTQKATEAMAAIPAKSRVHIKVYKKEEKKKTAKK